jgi:type IV secretory pathway VirB10-like protein
MRQNLSDGRTKMLLVVGLILALIFGSVGYMAFTGGDAESQAHTPSLPMTSGVDANDEVSPVQRQLIREADEQRLVEARRGGGAAIPSMIVEPEKPAAPALGVRGSSSTVEMAQDTHQSQTTAQHADQAAMQRKLAFMQALIAGESLAPAVITSVRSSSENNGSTSTDKKPTNQGETAPPSQTFPIVSKPPAQSIIYAFITGDVVSTDTGAPVRAQLVEGSYKGLTAIGTFVQREDTLLIEFSQLADKDGNTLPFKGVAVDAQTQRPTLSDDVDHHYWERFALVFGSAFIQGLGDAYSAANTATTTTLYGSTTSKGDIGLGDASITAAGKVGESVGQTLGKAAVEKPSTVTLYQGRPIGILVLE